MSYTLACLPDGLAEPFWTVPQGTMIARLGSIPLGLASAEAERRLGAAGPNTVADRPRLEIAAKIGRRLIEPLVAILLVAALVSGLTGDWPGFAIIACIVAVSVGLDVVQGHRAELAAERLRDSVAVRAAVRRDGRVAMLPVEQIVPGDVVDLGAGGLVPADGILSESHGTQANEALLTGEPYPVGKQVGTSNASGPAEAFNAVFAGTAIVAGSATMLVVATGRATRLGAVAASLAARRSPTASQKGLHGLGLLILRLTVFLVLFVLLARLGFHRPPLESFLFAVALAVGLTPELLPMVTTVTLSRGAMRMARKQVVVKRLAAIHDLGAMDVLCTDKTGTLTEAKIVLADATGADGAPSHACWASPRSMPASQVGADDAGRHHPVDQPAGAGWRCWPRRPSASNGGAPPCFAKGRRAVAGGQRSTRGCARRMHRAPRAQQRAVADDGSRARRSAARAETVAEGSACSALPGGACRRAKPSKGPRPSRPCLRGLLRLPRPRQALRRRSHCAASRARRAGQDRLG